MLASESNSEVRTKFAINTNFLAEVVTETYADGNLHVVELVLDGSFGMQIVFVIYIVNFTTLHSPVDTSGEVSTMCLGEYVVEAEAHCAAYLTVVDGVVNLRGIHAQEGHACEALNGFVFQCHSVAGKQHANGNHKNLSHKKFNV